MDKERVAEDLPFLLFYYGQVVERLERPTTRASRKFPRKAALDLFLATRSATATARALGVSPSSVQQVVSRAFRTARELANSESEKAVDGE